MKWLTSTPFGSLAVQSTLEGFDPAAIIDGFRYSRTLRQDLFSIVVTQEAHPWELTDYRVRMARKGLYLGHHLGPPGEVHPSVDHLTLAIPGATAAEIGAIFWSYALKLYLGIRSLQADALHLKAATLRHPNNGTVDLLIGRGGSGKTRLAAALCPEGFVSLGNTHAIVADDHVWAINTWHRVRSSGADRYEPPACSQIVGDGPIGRLVLVDHNREARCQIRRLKSAEVDAYFRCYALGLGAYDLKEDLHDVFGSWESIGELWRAEAAAFKLLLSRAPCWYLSCDVDSAKSRAVALRFFLCDT